MNLNLRPPAKPWPDLSEAERLMEVASLDAGLLLKNLPWPDGGRADVRIGSPIPSEELVPVMVSVGGGEGLRCGLPVMDAVKLHDAAPPAKHDHRQVRVHHGAAAMDVDEELALLLPALWQAGIHTLMSCQHYDPRVSTAGPGVRYGVGRPLAWITFPSAADADRFGALARDAGVACDVVHVKDGALRGSVHVLFPRRAIAALAAALRV